MSVKITPSEPLLSFEEKLRYGALHNSYYFLRFRLGNAGVGTKSQNVERPINTSTRVRRFTHFLTIGNVAR